MRKLKINSKFWQKVKNTHPSRISHFIMVAEVKKPKKATWLKKSKSWKAKCLILNSSRNGTTWPRRCAVGKKIFTPLSANAFLNDPINHELLNTVGTSELNFLICMFNTFLSCCQSSFSECSKLLNWTLCSQNVHITSNISNCPYLIWHLLMTSIYHILIIFVI